MSEMIICDRCKKIISMHDYTCDSNNKWSYLTKRIRDHIDDTYHLCPKCCDDFIFFMEHRPLDLECKHNVNGICQINGDNCIGAPCLNYEMNVLHEFNKTIDQLKKEKANGESSDPAGILSEE